MIILHPYAPGVRGLDQLPTWKFLRSLDANGLSVVHYPCYEDTSYAKALAYFSTRDIIIIEQDIAPTLSDLVGLIDSPYPFAAADYRLGSGTLWSHKVPMVPCLGFAKIKASAWSECGATGPNVPIVHWRELADRCAELLPAVHVRPEVAHHQNYKPVGERGVPQS